MRLPKNFPYRIATVPGWAEVFHVPRHIVRIDIDEPGKAGTHGWQVRYERPWKFIGDTVNGKRRTPRASLKAASAYLAGVYAGPRSQLRTTPTRRRKNVIQEAGIRLVSQLKRGRSTLEFYVEAMSPNHSLLPRRVYVGTEATVTPERFEAAKEKARELRRALEQQHLQTRAAIGF